MRVELLDFELPESAIATRPPAERQAARLLVVDPEQAGFTDRTMIDLPRLIPAGSLVVLNETQVIRARLLGCKVESSGKVELLLLQRLEGSSASEPGMLRYSALGRGFSPFRPGLRVSFGEGQLLGELERRRPEDGLLEVKLWSLDGSPPAEAIGVLGQVPLPPYMRRPAEAADEERYQTVYARVPGAVAAPTAGLHFTRELLEELEARKIHVARLTLHVGLGTFEPVSVPDLDRHSMHAEWMDVSPEVVDAVADARDRGASVVAVGTTVVRALRIGGGSGA